MQDEGLWPDAILDAARMEGDPEVDQLVEKVLGPEQVLSGIGRLGYNKLLDIADKLLEAPELSFVESSRVRQQLKALPPQLVDYFDPVEVPNWVEGAKLALAGRIWAENTLGILSVLYSASLPYCYLAEKGIPSLYKTKKLLEHRYIFQRLYETGLMLEGVMGAGGLKVISDLDEDVGQLVEHAPKRYLWGKGFISAKKVRLLHSCMRFMLTRPDLFQPRGDIENPASLSERLSHETKPWPKEELGLPVNQEDLAYALLTFGYIIPIGLERWGCKLSSQEKEAFLHTWKLIGHIMGIKQGLLPANWSEAESLFKTIKGRQAGASRPGEELTEALMRFLEDYLPPLFGIHKSLPPILIRDQLGKDDAAKVLNEERVRAAEGLFARAVFCIGRTMVWVYFLIRNQLFRRFPTVSGFMGEVFHRAGEEFINSWRDAYSRRPFYVPTEAEGGWKSVHGVDEAFLRDLARWRRALFYNIAAGVACIVVTGSTLLLSLTIYFVGLSGAVTNAGWSSLGFLLLGMAILKFRVPAVVRKRPQPSLHH